ncbi:UNVERIFIED_CONTAM: hypothetical protein ABIC26_000478 [Paenibacillus sp. PvR008]
MKLFEIGNVDDGLFVERLTALKIKHDKPARRKSNLKGDA